MKKQEQAIPQNDSTSFSADLAALDLNALLGGIIPASEAAKQLKNPKLRAGKAKPKEKKVRHDFAPPVSHPPRGPDQQIGKKEITYTEHLKSEIAYFRHKAFSATARENFLTTLLGA